MVQAASTGQSCTHCSGGGVVVAPCSRRASSFAIARFSASRPGVDSNGATPSRHTLRQLSMIQSPSRADSAMVLARLFSAPITSYGQYTFVQVGGRDFLSDFYGFLRFIPVKQTLTNRRPAAK